MTFPIGRVQKSSEQVREVRLLVFEGRKSRVIYLVNHRIAVVRHMTGHDAWFHGAIVEKLSVGPRLSAMVA